MKYLLNDNYGYKWQKTDASYFKGYFQLKDKLYQKDEAVELLNTVDSFEDFISLLKDLYGVFSIVLVRDEETWIAVDISRSMPLYYSLDTKCVSDNVISIRDDLRLTNEDVNASALDELLHEAYIGHTRTVYKNISQVDAGQAVRICHGDVTIRKQYYYCHRKPIIKFSEEESLDKFQEVSNAAFDRIISAANGRPIVISLSGGYDSRYVACMLKSRGADNVSCYSYGRANSFEIEQSKRVADALGYRWTFIEHTNETMLKEYGKDVPYYEMYNGIDSTYYIQNYVAVKHLHEQGWFLPNSVFVTGLCNDMSTGAYVKPESYYPSFEPTIDYLVKHILSRRNLNVSLTNKSRNEYINELESVINDMGISICSYQDFVSATDSIEAILMHSRLFLHMNDVHEFFGYEWLLPCWDKDLLNFWYSMPLEYRINQNLYEKWINERIPSDYGVGEKKKKVAYTLYKGFPRLKARVRIILKRVLFLPFGISIVEETDYNNWGTVMKLLYKRIKQKELIGFKNMQINYFLTLDMLEKRFGTDFYRTIIKKSK